MRGQSHISEVGHEGVRPVSMTVGENHSSGVGSFDEPPYVVFARTSVRKARNPRIEGSSDVSVLSVQF